MELETKTASVSFIEGRYLLVRFKPNESIDKAQAEEIIKKVHILLPEGANIPFGNIIDATDMFFISGSARKYFAESPNPDMVGVALLVKSQIQAGFANLYMKFTRQASPTKVFYKMENAKQWISDRLDTKE